MSRKNRGLCIVTGASRGIGAATARLLAADDHPVLCLARSEQALTTLAEEIESQGGTALPRSVDIADSLATTAAIDDAIAKFGTPEVLVNNAGTIDPIAHLADSDALAWGRVIDINLKGVYNGVRAVLPAMLDAGGGTIVNISSGAATNPLEGWSHYCVSKAAVLMLTRCIHHEYGSRGIRAIGLSPGTVATEMQRSIAASGINRVSQMDFADHIPPDWVAKAIVYLQHQDADDYLGRDFTLKTDEERARVGLPPVSTSP